MESLSTHNIMKLLCLCLFLLAFSQDGFSQKGNSFLTHFSPSDERIDYRSGGMLQDERGLIYFTNKKGVLEFDGKNWQLIYTPGAVFTISLLNNEIFVGGTFGFGKLINKNNNQRGYQSFSTRPGVFSSVVVGDKIYACNENVLLVSTSDKIEKEIKATATENFTGLLGVHEKIFVKSSLGGINQLEGDKLATAVLTLPSEAEIIFSSTDVKLADVLVGTDDNRIFTLNEKKLVSEILPVDASYIQQNKLISGVWVSENLIALGTLLGGVVLVNPKTGVTEDILNYNSGLPDNDIFALMLDRNEGVWVAHEYGFTRIAPSIPFRSFNHYSGLSGNLLCTRSINNQVYVGTTLGLFKLSKDEAKQVSSARIQNYGKEKSSNPGQLNFLKKKNRNNADNLSSKSTGAYVKIIKPESYSFKKIEGITGKVTQLIDINGKLIASGLSGVFEVESLQAKPIIEEAIHSIFFSPSLHQLLVSTYHGGLKSFLPGLNWKETHLIDSLNDHVSYAFEDEIQNVWLCGRSQVYKIETLEGEISEIIKIPINNSDLDEIVGVAYGSDVYLATSGEFKKFDGHNSFVKYDSLPGLHRYFASAGYFWFNDGNKWRTVDRKLQSLKLQWLGLFPNLRFLTPDEKAENLWVITADNELYRFSGDTHLSEDQPYPLFLRGVHGQEINLLPDRKVIMDQPENVFSFEFIQPDYVSRQAMQYRYQVNGLTNGWTSWASGNYVADFPFLPPGSYNLAMQSRDLLGQESKVELISFDVLPPYWKRWWFYAVEFLFFGVLMVLSLKLSLANAKYRYISQILSLLTVIILIEFIQTGISSVITIKSSPVVQFFIQVFIALLVFPLEAYFRKFMQETAEGKYQLKFKPKQD